ncbi:MAG: HD domain-containing protein, partial [Bacteroidota bacterium]
ATAGSDLLEAVDKKVENFSQQTRQLIDTHQTAAVSDALREVKGALRDTMDYLRSVIYRTQSHIRLEVETISFSDLITEALEVLEVQEIVDRPRPIVKYLAKDQELQCDATRIQQLLVNALFYAQQHGHPQQSVLLGIQATTLGYPIPSVKNHIKEVDALCIMVTRAETLPISKVLYMGATGRASFHIPQSTEDLALLDNQRIVDAHYGATELIVSDEGLVQVYVIPLRLREVRPKMMDIPQMEIGGIGEASQEVLPEETALLTRFEKEAHIDMELATKAIQIIKKYHGHAKYKSGEPFYLHPIASTEILLDYTQDSTAILATLLHDTVKDTALTLAEIGTIFGADVAAIVNKVTHLEGQFQRIHMDEHENIHQVLEESDTQVLQVKLADRTHNMRTIQRHPRIAKQKKIAEETLHFFVPIAKHLGLKQLEEELQGMVNAVMSK